MSCAVSLLDGDAEACHARLTLLSANQSREPIPHRARGFKACVGALGVAALLGIGALYHQSELSTSRWSVPMASHLVPRPFMQTQYGVGGPVPTLYPNQASRPSRAWALPKRGKGGVRHATQNPEDQGPASADPQDGDIVDLLQEDWGKYMRPEEYYKQKKLEELTEEERWEEEYRKIPDFDDETILREGDTEADDGEYSASEGPKSPEDLPDAKDYVEPEALDLEEVTGEDGEDMPHHRHKDLEGRTLLKDIELGTEFEGTVSALLLWHGVMVDIGAEFDGLVYVSEDDMLDVRDFVPIDQKVRVRVKKVFSENTDRFVFPLELQLLDPDISDLQMSPDREHAPIRIPIDDIRKGVITMEELAEQAGRDLNDLKNPLRQELIEVLQQGKQSRKEFGLGSQDGVELVMPEEEAEKESAGTVWDFGDDLDDDEEEDEEEEQQAAAGPKNDDRALDDFDPGVQRMPEPDTAESAEPQY